MSISSIQNNLAAMVKKAYHEDTKPSSTSINTLKSLESDPAKATAGAANDHLNSASAQVTLGEAGNLTEIYTAKGLVQQTLTPYESEFLEAIP